MPKLEKYICPRNGIGYERFKRGDVVVRYTFSTSSGRFNNYYTFEEAKKRYGLTSQQLESLKSGKTFIIRRGKVIE